MGEKFKMLDKIEILQTTVTREWEIMLAFILL